MSVRRYIYCLIFLVHNVHSGLADRRHTVGAPLPRYRSGRRIGKGSLARCNSFNARLRVDVSLRSGTARLRASAYEGIEWPRTPRCRQHGQQYGNSFAAADCFGGHSDGTEVGEIVFRLQLLCFFQYGGKGRSVASVP